MFLRNVGWFSAGHTALFPRRQSCSFAVVRKIIIKCKCWFIWILPQMGWLNAAGSLVRFRVLVSLLSVNVVTAFNSAPEELMIYRMVEGEHVWHLISSAFSIFNLDGSFRFCPHVEVTVVSSYGEDHQATVREVCNASVSSAVKRPFPETNPYYWRRAHKSR
jgi:hypothetical protein